VFSRCHIVAFPSSSGERVPPLLLEAAACGRPVVASDLPGCRHVVVDGETGFLVPPRDAEALAGALDRLAWSRELRESMGQAGRQRVVERFSAAEIDSATLEVYRHLLGEGAWAPVV